MSQSKIIQLAVDQLRTDPTVQRPLDLKRANRIASELNPSAIGVICVSVRDDGNNIIIDGQHRVEALRIAGKNKDKIPCEVYIGLSRPEEAAMFRIRNNTKEITRLDKFRVRLVEEDVVALAIMKILHEHGWYLPGQEGPAKGRFAAVAAIERIFNADPFSDPNAAHRAITTVTAAWGHDEDAVNGHIVEGVGKFYLKNPNAATSDVISKLSIYDGGPRALYGKAGVLKDSTGSLTGAIVEMVTVLYNKGKRTRRLPLNQ